MKEKRLHFPDVWAAELFILAAGIYTALEIEADLPDVVVRYPDGAEWLVERLEDRYC